MPEETINQRIEHLLKILELKRVEFGAAINVTGSFISQICSGAKVPGERTILDICAKFNVSETWLRTGQGEPFLPPDPDKELRDVFTAMLLAGVSDPVLDLAKSILRKYWTLPDSDKAAVRKFVDSVLDDYKKSTPD